MGMFDTISVTEKTREEFGLPEGSFQTKSFWNGLSHFIIDDDKKLYELTPDKKYYVERTKEEREKESKRCHIELAWITPGYYQEAAWLPENMIRSFYGTHKWAHMYTIDADEDWVDVYVKFTDGVLQKAHVLRKGEEVPEGVYL